jgi:hypothetical protein
MPDSLAPWLNDPTQMSPMTNLGLQLLANSNTPGGFGSIFGRSALAAGQDYQAAQIRQQQIQQALLNQQIAQQKMAFLGTPGGMGGPQGATPQQGMPQGPGAPPQAAPGASQGAQPFGFTQPPQGAQAAPGQAPAPQSQGQPNPWLQVPSSQDISRIPIGGMSPDWLARYSVAIENKNPLEAYKDVHDQQEKLAQQQLAPKIASLDYLLKSDKPSTYMQADKQLMAAWPQLAQQAGLDPQKDYNDDGVRHALTLARNSFASAVGLPTVEPTNRLKNITLPDGRTAQVDPMTGKETIEAASDLEKVIGPNGQPTLVPKGKAAGMTPFNQSIFGASNMDDQTKEMAYQFAKANGGKLPPWMNSRGDAAKGAMANYISKRAVEEGDTATSIIARGQATQAAQGVVSDFTKGKTATTLNGLNTAIGHMDQLDQAATALKNGNVQALNKVSNFFGTQFGSSATTNFNVVKNFAAGEVAKAVLPGGGGEREREEIADAIKNSNSPDQLHSAIQTWRNLLSSKTEALRNQWDVGTNGTQGSFDKFLMPATKKALGIGSEPAASAHPADIQDLLSKYGH